MANIEKYLRGVKGCVRCGICRSKYNPDEKILRVCPTGEHSAGFWTDFPVGRVALALDILEGRLELSDVPVEDIYECTLCANCRQVCGATDMTTLQPLVDIPEIIKAMRADLFASGVEIPEAVNMYSDAIERTQNIFGAPAAERNSWLTPDIKLDTDADTIYFPGCLPSYRVQESAKATAKILNKMDVKFNILGEDEQCCGNPMIMVGNLFLAKELMRHNYEFLKDKRVITSCAGCYKTFHDEYPKLIGKEFKIDVTHIVKVLADHIDQGKLEFTKEIKEKIVYHDPCELGREMGVYDEPRKILTSIPGLELVEFDRTREKTWCCGGGGGLKGIDFDLSVEIGKDKVEEAISVGATTIVSACPSCKTNINDAIRTTGAEVKMVDITELVVEALV